MPKRKPISVPLNRIQGKGKLKYDISKIPPKLRKTVPLSKSCQRKEEDGQKDEISAHCSYDNDMVNPDSVQFEHSASVTYSIPIDDTFQLYCLAINQSNYFSPCNEDFTAFAMADFDNIKQEIMKQKIQIVKRKVVSFTDDMKWLYSCTCNGARAEYIESISNMLKYSSQDFQEVTCEHIRLTQHIVRDLDTLWKIKPELLECDHSYGTQKDLQEMDLVELDLGIDNLHIAVMQTDITPGVVSVWSGSVYCFTCQNTYCKHCKHIKKYMNKSDHEEVPDVVYRLLELLYGKNKQTDCTQTYVYKSLSKKEINFRLLEKLRPPFLSLSFIKEDDVFQIFPDEFETPVCTECQSQWDDNCFGQQKKNIPLFRKYEVHQAAVFGKKCLNCDNKLLFDGGSSCILNMNSFLVHHEVLRDYMWHFLQARCTLYAYYTIWAETMKDMGVDNFRNIMSYAMFRHSWYSYLDLLEIDYTHGFTCPHCKEAPDTVVCDATALSFRKSFVKWTSTAVKPTDVLNGRFKDRVIIDDKKTRSLLQKFSTGTTIEEDEFQYIEDNIKKYLPSALIFFKMLRDIESTTTCPKEYRSLLQLLCSPSPACALLASTEENEKIIADVLKIVDELANHPALLLLVQHNLPMLYDIIKDIGVLDNSLKAIISAIFEKSKDTFKGSYFENKCSSELSVDVGSFFPVLDKVRERGLFSADRMKKDTDSCKKDSTRHPTLLPGIFTVFCKHGFCYGFQVMENNESPNVPFTFLRTRFKKPPSVVVYDNACNLHAYCLNRDPGFFRNTLFVVDNMHWGNHKTCSKVYHARFHQRLQGVNTQMVEQNNSKLRKLKSQLSYMNFDNFMNHLKFFLWNCNRNVLEKFQHM